MNIAIQKCILVRRSPRHACVAHVLVNRATQDIELLRVTPDKGAMPSLNELPRRYRSMRLLRAALIERMTEGETNGE